jgi:hypothetical protein
MAHSPIQIQLSSCFPKQHLSSLISFKMYMLFGVLIVVSTSLPDPSFLISHYFELNISVCPLSHIWLTLSKLCFIFSTSKTFHATTSLFPRLILPFPIILVELSLPNMTEPSFSFFNVTNCFFSLVICFEHPLSIYQWLLLFWACKENPHSSTFKSYFFIFQVLCCSYI